MNRRVFIASLVANLACIKLAKGATMVGENTFINSVRSALSVYDAANQPTSPILALVGDSRFSGDWNTILGRNDIVNLSVAGLRSQTWKDSWQVNVASIPSTVRRVIIQFGKNDIDAEIPSAEIAQNIQDIATLIHNYGPSGVKCGVLGTLPVTVSAPNAAITNSKTQALLPFIVSKMASASPIVRYYEGYQGLVSNGALIAQNADSGGAHLNNEGKVIYASSLVALEAMLT